MGTERVSCRSVRHAGIRERIRDSSSIWNVLSRSTDTQFLCTTSFHDYGCSQVCWRSLPLSFVATRRIVSLFRSQPFCWLTVHFEHWSKVSSSLELRLSSGARFVLSFMQRRNRREAVSRRLHQ